MLLGLCLSCLSSINIRHVHFNFYVYWSQASSTVSDIALGKLQILVVAHAAEMYWVLQRMQALWGRESADCISFGQERISCLKFVFVKRSNFGEIVLV